MHLAAALALGAPAAVGVALLVAPSAAQAQRAVIGAPQIDRLEVVSAAGLAPGAELQLRLYGTPRGHASVRISAAKPVNITLRESPAGSGEYMADYTIKRADRLRPGQTVRATLRRGKLSTVSDYTIPEVPASPSTPPPSAGPIRIDRFSSAPVNRLSPGTELVFTLEAAPGARASFDIGGIASDLPMREVRPGVYEGRYTLRRQDRVTPATPVTASVRAGAQVARTTLAQPLLNDVRPPAVANLSPRENERVPAGMVYVSGNFEAARGTGVDPRSVRLYLNGRDVTSATQITAQSFSHRDPLGAGACTALLTARDGACNELRRYDIVLVATKDRRSDETRLRLNQR